MPGTSLAQQPNRPPSRPGFPVTLPGGGTVRAGHPAIADLGLPPGQKCIIFATTAKRLYVIRADGTVAPGFPVTLPAESNSSPAVADIDGDGKPDIVVGYGSLFTPSDPGGVRAYKNNGALLWDRPSADIDQNGIPDPVVAAPAIGDVDGDGLPDVAWGSLDARVYLVNGATGADKPGWPRFVYDTVFSSPALADIDGDGKADIVVGSDAHLGSAPVNTPDGGCLHVLRWDGAEVVGFPRCVDQVVASSPSVGDIDGDGKPEIVVGTGRFWPNRAHRVYAFHCDGTTVAGWPVSTDGQVSTSPALADLDGNGIPEVIVTDDNTGPSATYAVYAFNGNGARRFRAVPKDFFGMTLSAGEPVVADILGDGNVEILVPTNGEICVLSNAGVQLSDDGSHTGAYSFAAATSLSNAAAEDLDSDGKVEVVAVSATPFPSATDAEVWVWNPKPGTAGARPWPVFRQNATRRGIVPGTPSCANANAPMMFYTLAPCRVLDTRNASGPYGGPAIPAQDFRTFFVLNRCGIPSDARAVAANLTVVSPSANGNLRIYGGEGPAPFTSVINFRPGQIRANNATVRIGAGQISIENDQLSGSVQVVLDVSGYFK